MIAVMANRIVVEGLAAGTQKAYLGHMKKYLTFAIRHGIAKLGWLQLPSEMDMLFFVAKLAEDGLKAGTIKCTLAGVSSSFVGLGFRNPLKDRMGSMLPLLHRAVRGVSRLLGGPRRRRDGLTVDKLARALQKMLEACDGNVYNCACLSFALALGVFQMLRVAEMVSPGTKRAAHDPLTCLNVEDLEFLPTMGPAAKFLDTNVKLSKTDPFRFGSVLRTARTDGDVCPVELGVAFLKLRGRDDPKGPVFTMADGSLLTRDRLQRYLRRALELAGFSGKNFGTHSMRLGGMQSLVAAGWAPDLVKVMSRHASDAALGYMQMSDAQKQDAARSMARIRTQDVLDSMRRSRQGGEEAM